MKSYNFPNKSFRPKRWFIPADSNGKLERHPWESAMPPKNKFHILADKNNESFENFLQLILSAIGRIIKKCICKMSNRYNSRLLPYCSQTYLVRFIYFLKRIMWRTIWNVPRLSICKVQKFIQDEKKKNDFFRKVCINLKDLNIIYWI